MERGKYLFYDFYKGASRFILIFAETLWLVISSYVIKFKWGLRSAKLWLLLSIIATNFFIKLILKNEKFILLSRNILSKIILSTTPQYAFIKFESATYRHVYRFNAYNFLGSYHLHRRSMKAFTLISCLRDIPKEHKKHVI